MIVDIHSHCWPNVNCFSQTFLTEFQRVRSTPANLLTPPGAYQASCGGEDVVAIVFGGKAKLSGIWVNDADVAAYVARDPKRFIGFMSLDPTQPGWAEEMHEGYERLKFRGIKIMPMYAGFYPQHDRVEPLWGYAKVHNLPVLLHTGTTFVAKAPIDCTLPRHLDVVANQFPQIKIILAHMGHPYEGETIAVIRKHPNVYADISALCYRPWQLFNTLMLVHEYNVWDKVLFGTDYPIATVAETLEGLRRMAEVRVDSFSLPKEKIEELIHRDTLSLLGLGK